MLDKLINPMSHTWNRQVIRNFVDPTDVTLIERIPSSMI